MLTLSETSFASAFSSQDRLRSALQYAVRFTETYQGSVDCGPFEREIRMLRVQFPHLLQPAEAQDRFVGRIRYELVGLSPEPGGLGYYCAPNLIQALDSELLTTAEKREVQRLLDFWSSESTRSKVRQAYPPELAQRLPSDDWTEASGVAFPLYRMGGSVLDYGKLLRLGLDGMVALLQSREGGERNSQALAFLRQGFEAIRLLQHSIDWYRGQTKDARIRKVLESIRHAPPQTFREAIQLFWLVALHAGTWNYGRLDTVLGPFLCRDLDDGTLCESEAMELLCSLWRLMHAYDNHYNNRVIVGGLGRESEECADRFALLAIEATRRLRLNQPQLSLRFHSAQNPELWDRAIDAIAEGCTFPILYNDDVNVPAVAAAHRVDLEMAAHYVPYGCGEYVLGHHAAASPNGVINLLKALEVSLHGGVDPITGLRIVDGIPSPECLHTFESVWDAYCKVVDHHVEALARQQKIEYDVVGQICAFPWISLLTNDCIETGKPVFAGGVRYLCGTIETYGNTNAANSLHAIRELVFEQKVVSLAELVDALDGNFAHHPELLAKLRAVSKYGNDEALSDAMAVRVHEHVCNASRDIADAVGLHSYLVVIINNWANTVLGWKTGASAEGRLAGEPMANANNPSPGSDGSGVTAFLNSIAKPDPALHAGSVQNMKFSKEWFGPNRGKFDALLRTYFARGGTQAMITVVSRQDLESALREPEKWGHLMVRVGGFSIRFIDLPPDAQKELIQRTLY